MVDIRQDPGFARSGDGFGIRDLAVERPLPRANHAEPGVPGYAPPAKPALGRDRPVVPPPVPEVQLDDLEDKIKAQVQAHTGDPVAAIRISLKRLTHRQMRELCAAIFAARKTLAAPPSPLANAGAADVAATITQAELPDVLDRFAYEE